MRKLQNSKQLSYAPKNLMTIGNKSWGVSKINPNVYECCGEQPTHIFIYENDIIYTVCAIHFTIFARYLDVKNIIDYKTGKKISRGELVAPM